MKQKRRFISIFLVMGDIFFMYLALFLALVIRNKDLVVQADNFVYNFSILYLFWILVIFVLDFYEIYFFKKPIDFLLNLMLFSFLAIFSGIAYFYFFPNLGMTPKTILILDVIIFGIFFLCWRYAFSRILENKKLKEKVAIIGYRQELKEVISHANKNIYEVTAIFCPSYLEGYKQCLAIYGGGEIISDVDKLKDIVIEKGVNSIVFAVDFHFNKDLIQNIFSKLPLTLNYISFNDFYELITKKVLLESLNEIWFLEKISRPENKLNNMLKRLFDIIFSFLGLFILIIIFPIIATIIKIDSKGYILYRQKRFGKEKKVFTMYKFRTMIENPNQDKETWREKNKNNITRVGRFLRKTHLDELPQFWSILMGHLSFVGPRPEWVELAEVFEKKIPFYLQRYLIKPGFTGWAQLNFPVSSSIKEAKEKFEYDLYYIKNRSFFLDLVIILKTIQLIFR